MARLLSIVSLVLAASASFAAAVPSRTAPRDTLSLNPDASTVQVAAAVEVRDTNAARFAQGLNPLNPSHRRRKNFPARAQASGLPTAVIAVKHADGSFAGYLAPALNAFKEYGTVVQEKKDALKVAYDPAATAAADLLIVDPQDSKYTFFGGIVGFSSTSDDFAVGSYNYAYIGPTTRTDSLAAPTTGGNGFTDATKLDKKIESAIWTVNTATGYLTAQWINTDKSSPATFFGITQGVLVLTGDKNSFTNTFGPTDYVTMSIEAI